MPDIILTFTNEINTSVQVGDTAYYSTVNTTGGFSTSSSITYIGPISLIDTSNKQIVCNPASVSSSSQPPEGSFILFSKDNRVNMASPIGYYGQAKFKNDSTTKGEMFSAACEVFESSK